MHSSPFRVTCNSITVIIILFCCNLGVQDAYQIMNGYQQTCWTKICFFGMCVWTLSGNLEYRPPARFLWATGYALLKSKYLWQWTVFLMVKMMMMSYVGSSTLEGIIMTWFPFLGVFIGPFWRRANKAKNA